VKPASHLSTRYSSKFYPYDNGFSHSYVVCFEAYDGAYASRSPFVIYALDDRFKGYHGDKAAVVRATYSSSCFYKDQYLCVDTRFGRFFELDPTRSAAALERQTTNR
jgi:hypothetical protein